MDYYIYLKHMQEQRERDGAGYTLRIGCKDHTAWILVYAMFACLSATLAFPADDVVTKTTLKSE